jgi:hypothetical protein
VTLLDMQPLQARFATQDQAESAMRKLTALRSDGFRLERTAAYDSAGAEAIVDLAQSLDGLTASALASSTIQPSSGVMESEEAGNQWGFSPQGTSSGDYTLSANVPGMAAEQARTVILQAGGQIV